MKATVLRALLMFACVALVARWAGGREGVIDIPQASVVIDGDAAEWAGIAAAATDPSGDAFSEAADLELVKLGADERNLYVLVQANKVPGYTGKTDQWDHAERSLYVEIEGSGRDAATVQVRGTREGVQAAPEGVVSAVDASKGITEVAIPLALVGESPVMLTVRSGIIYFVSETMAGYEGSDRLPDTGAVIISIPTLPQDTRAPTVQDAGVEGIGARHAVAVWQTDEKTDTRLELFSGEGAPRIMRKLWLTRRHHVYLEDLAPATKYRLAAGGADLAGNASESREVSFTTLGSEATAAETGDRRLRVEGRYIVDATGAPFKLAGFGISLSPNYTGGMTYKLMGDFDSWCDFSQRRGMNCLRIGVAVKSDWNEGFDAARYGGFDGYISRIIDPVVQACKRNGMYAVIDAHAGVIDRPTLYEWLIPFWQAVARRYKDEPWVAVYELYNEPYTKEFGLSPASGPLLRQWYADCVKAVREIDDKHIIMVSDWNAGWGSATESMWAPVSFRADAPFDQVVFSKHIAKDHCTAEFLKTYVDDVSEKWDVPIVVGEFELGTPFMTEEAFAVYLDWLRDNPGRYAWWAWSIDFAEQWDRLLAPFFRAWASPVPGFGATEKFLFEDFEGPDAIELGTWQATRGGEGPAIRAELAAPGCEGWGKCLRVTFGAGTGKPGWASVWCPWVFPRRWGELTPDRVGMVLRGDGTPAKAYRLAVLVGEDPFKAPTHRAGVPIDDATWHKVVLKGGAFTPPVTDFSKVQRIQFDAEAPPGEVTFEVDRITFEAPAYPP